jgi:hypothetical protein
MALKVGIIVAGNQSEFAKWRICTGCVTSVISDVLLQPSFVNVVTGPKHQRARTTGIFLAQSGSQAVPEPGMRVISTLLVTCHRSRAAGGVQKIP